MTEKQEKLLNGKNNKEDKNSKELCDICGVKLAPKHFFDESYCHTCNIVLSSTVIARSHYEGKSHAKKLFFYLDEH